MNAASAATPVAELVTTGTRMVPGFPTSGQESELRVRASQISRLTYRQFETIRELAIESGLPPQVAAITAWLAADPQEVLAQLKRHGWT